MRVDHISRRVAQQMLDLDTIRLAYDHLVRVGHEQISRQRIQTRLEALNDQWEKFRLNHLALRLAIDKVNPDERRALDQHSYSKDDLYSLTYDHYLVSMERMTSLLHEQPEIVLVNPPLTPTPKPALIFVPSSPAPTHHDPKLPRIRLPTHDGTHEDWLPFRELFYSVVDSNQTISDIEKLQYLKSCIHGSAAQMLSNTTLTAENFAKAWENLIFFYENPRFLVGVMLDQLLNLKRIKKESSTELESLFTVTSQIYQNLESLQRPVKQWDDILVHLIVRLKLESDTIRAWEIYLGDCRSPPTWNQFQAFLRSRIITLRAIEKSSSHSTSHSSSHFRRPPIKSHFAGQSANRQQLNSQAKKVCSCCSDNHYISKCPVYLNKSLNQRLKFTQDEKLCYNCLGQHIKSECQSTYRCSKCAKRHHTLLHGLNIQPSGELSTSISSSPKHVNHVHQIQENPPSRTIMLLATAKINVYNEFGEIISVRALLDQGSEISLVSQKLVQRLRIPRRHSSIPIIGVGAQQSGKTKGLVSFNISSHFNFLNLIQVNAQVLPKLTSLVPSSYSMGTNWPHLTGLTLADPNFSEPENIDVIIGVDLYGKLLEGPIIQGPENSPTAQVTKLAWIISGPTRSSSTPLEICTLHCTVDHDLYSLLERFWHLEEIKTPSSSSKLSTEDENCEEVFKKTHTRDKTTGKYIVKLPFKSSPNLVGNSKIPALRMLQYTQKKFHNDSAYFDLYSSFLKEYEDLKHMIRVPENDPEPQPVFYLPHHGVKRESNSALS